MSRDLDGTKLPSCFSSSSSGVWIAQTLGGRSVALVCSVAQQSRSYRNVLIPTEVNILQVRNQAACRRCTLTAVKQVQGNAFCKMYGYLRRVVRPQVPQLSGGGTLHLATPLTPNIFHMDSDKSSVGSKHGMNINSSLSFMPTLCSARCTISLGPRPTRL